MASRRPSKKKDEIPEKERRRDHKFKNDRGYQVVQGTGKGKGQQRRNTPLTGRAKTKRKSLVGDRKKEPLHRRFEKKGDIAYSKKRS